MTNKSERWTGFTAHMGKIRNSYTVVLTPEKGDRLEDLVMDGKTILKWIFRKQGERIGLDLFGSV
jgi:hypothetical protein